MDAENPVQDASPAGRLQRGAERPVRLIRMICQMILGIGFAVALVLKVYMAVLTDHQCVADSTSLGNAIRCTPTLTMMAYVLALSAALDLARALFDEGLDRAVSPIIIGIGAALLSVLSGLEAGAPNWRDALVILALLASVGGLMWLRRNLMR